MRSLCAKIPVFLVETPAVIVSQHGACGDQHRDYWAYDSKGQSVGLVRCCFTSYLTELSILVLAAWVMDRTVGEDLIKNIHQVSAREFPGKQQVVSLYFKDNAVDQKILGPYWHWLFAQGYTPKDKLGEYRHLQYQGVWPRKDRWQKGNRASALPSVPTGTFSPLSNPAGPSSVKAPARKRSHLKPYVMGAALVCIGTFVAYKNCKVSMASTSF